MPFGPTNAPSYFQHVMTKIFGDFKFVVVYMDDISILSKTIDEHIQHLKLVFQRLVEWDIRLRVDKCIFATNETQYLGFLINKFGISPTPKYKQKILNVPIPTDV